MRKGAFAAACSAVTLFVVLGGTAQDGVQREELVTEFVRAMPVDATTNAEVYGINGFRVESSLNKELGADLKPNGNEFQLVSVTASGVFRAIVEKGRQMSTGGGFAVIHRDSGSPMLMAGDSDGDGSLDGLTYAKVDSDGKVLVEVTDYEADGQLDIRTNFADR